MAREPSVAKYLDVPIQHVDDAVLKSMRRGHGSKVVYDLVDRVRAQVPGVTLRSTFIVGHPGETEAAFTRLCDFVREAQLDRVGVFNYSREEGTVAALLPKRVPRRRSTPVAASSCASSARSRSRRCAPCAAARSRSWSKGPSTSRSTC
jgi:tRNA A37 methylthiotransferase MiaB